VIEEILIFLNNIPERLLYLHYRKKYELHKSFQFNGQNIRLKGEGRIIIGPDCYIGSNSQLSALKNTTIHIGCECRIGHNVTIRTTTRKNSKGQNVRIGNNVWICNNTFICEGIRIHDNATIGANAVVTKHVREQTTVAGVPARRIR